MWCDERKRAPPQLLALKPRVCKAGPSILVLSKSVAAELSPRRVAGEILVSKSGRRRTNARSLTGRAADRARETLLTALADGRVQRAAVVSRSSRSRLLPEARMRSWRGPSPRRARDAGGQVASQVAHAAVLYGEQRRGTSRDSRVRRRPLASILGWPLSTRRLRPWLVESLQPTASLTSPTHKTKTADARPLCSPIEQY